MILQIKQDIEQLFKDKPRRLNHILGVYETATNLGKLHNLELEKLQMAALLHDITKYYSLEENTKIIKENYNNYDEILSEFNEKILHSFTARVVAEKKYNIKDVDILDSILYHTIGKENMSIYEQIIFISDYIEPNRIYESCVKVREQAFIDLNKATFTAISDYINYHESQNLNIPTQAYNAYEYYKMEVQNG